MQTKNFSDFTFEGVDYTVRKVDCSRYEIIYKANGQKCKNMKGIAQNYLKNEKIKEIKGHTYKVLKVLMAYLVYNK